MCLAKLLNGGKDRHFSHIPLSSYQLYNSIYLNKFWIPIYVVVHMYLDILQIPIFKKSNTGNTKMQQTQHIVKLNIWQYLLTLRRGRRRQVYKMMPEILVIFLSNFWIYSCEILLLQSLKLNGGASSALVLLSSSRPPSF